MRVLFSVFSFRTSLNIEIDLTHSGLFVLRPVALPQTQVRFVPDSIDSRRLDPWTVGQSVSELVTLPLLCESSDKSRAVSEAPPLSATSPQHSLPTQIHWLLLPPCRSPQVYRSSLCSNWGPRSNMLSYAKCLGLLQQYRSLPRTCPKLKLIWHIQDFLFCYSSFQRPHDIREWF